MKKTESIRVLIVDDHRVVRAGIRAILEEQNAFNVVGEAGCIHETLDLLPEINPHIVLMDMRLPDGSGSEACGKIKKLFPAVKVTILTSFVQETLVLSALAEGADGYLLKDCNDEILIQALHSIHKGNQVLAPAALSIVTGAFHKSSTNQNRLVFTPREWAILRHLSRGYTYKEISEKLKIAEKTVRNNVSLMLSKSHYKSRNELIVYFAQSDNGSADPHPQA